MKIEEIIERLKIKNCLLTYRHLYFEISEKLLYGDVTKEHQTEIMEAIREKRMLIDARMTSDIYEQLLYLFKFCVLVKELDFFFEVAQNILENGHYVARSTFHEKKFEHDIKIEATNEIVFYYNSLPNDYTYYKSNRDSESLISDVISNYYELIMNVGSIDLKIEYFWKYDRYLVNCTNLNIKTKKYLKLLEA